MGACSYVLSNMSARVYIYVQCICGWAHDITLTPEGQRNNSEPTKISWKTQICIGTCANICLPCISACTCTCVKKNYTCWPAYLFIFEVCVSLHIMDKTIMKKKNGHNRSPQTHSPWRYPPSPRPTFSYAGQWYVVAIPPFTGYSSLFCIDAKVSRGSVKHCPCKCHG